MIIPIKPKKYDFVREYKLVYTRDEYLMDVQFWFYGEYYAFPKHINNVTHFNPLYHYKKGKGIKVYYDMNNDDTDDKPMYAYFTMYPNKIELLEKKWSNYKEQLNKLLKNSKTKDLKKIFLLMANTFSMVVITNMVGKSKDVPKIVAKRAYEIRSKNDHLTYNVVKIMIGLAKKMIKKEHTKYLKYMTVEEILGIEKIKLNKLKERFNEFIFFEGKTYSGNELKTFKSKFKIKFIQDKVNKIKTSLKGNIACKGIAKGKVKIVLELKDLYKVKQGDVLITTMTTPNMVPAMERCCAIVTDEGGLTCHAAIVARELGKPCIVGTKFATKIFKNNDLVIVDANKGIVKKVK
jgi:phosphohistidine swiveling domain-containing protein